MESLEQMNQKVPAPSFPPCISISINRYNEIALNIFNNNLNLSHSEKRPEELNIKAQGVSHQEVSTELYEPRPEFFSKNILKNELV